MLQWIFVFFYILHNNAHSYYAIWGERKLMKIKTKCFSTTFINVKNGEVMLAILFVWCSKKVKSFKSCYYLKRELTESAAAALLSIAVIVRDFPFRGIAPNFHIHATVLPLRDSYFHTLSSKHSIF